MTPNCCRRSRAEDLYEEIISRALCVSVSFASVAEIDRVNIRQATFAAMRRALGGLAVTPRHVLVDGNDLPPHLACPGETLIKGTRDPPRSRQPLSLRKSLATG